MQLMNRFAEKLSAHSLPLRRARPEILQVNVGKLCNLTCHALSRERGAETQRNNDARDHRSSHPVAGQNGNSDRSILQAEHQK